MQGINTVRRSYIWLSAVFFSSAAYSYFFLLVWKEKVQEIFELCQNWKACADTKNIKQLADIL